MKKLLVIIFIFTIMLTTCTKDITGPDACFAEDILPVFISNCTMSGCHDSQSKKARYDLTTYEGIMKGIVAKHPLRSEIYNSISGINPSMPKKPYSELSNKDKNLIKLWINKGAKNTSNCKTCDSVDVNYSGRIKPMMETWCTGCHNATSSGGGFDLSNYGGVVAAVSSNKLLGSVKHSAGYLPMPQNGGSLSKCEIDALQKWINTGYPDN